MKLVDKIKEELKNLNLDLYEGIYMNVLDDGIEVLGTDYKYHKILDNIEIYDEQEKIKNEELNKELMQAYFGDNVSSKDKEVNINCEMEHTYLAVAMKLSDRTYDSIVMTEKENINTLTANDVHKFVEKIKNELTEYYNESICLVNLTKIN